MSKDPAARPSSAGAAIKEFERALREIASSSGNSGVYGTELAAGEQVGQWTVEKVIGRGGMGTVYRARRGDETAALKVLELGASTSTLQRFEREAMLMQDLSHPNIPNSSNACMFWPG